MSMLKTSTTQPTQLHKTMKTDIIAKGHAAIDLAKEDDTIQLNKYADPTEGEEEDISLDKAREVAGEDANLIFATRKGEEVW